MQDLNSNNYIQCFSIKNKNNNKILGFSLIELSIVLIIIGLLVAGITSGQSLIESAKSRAVMNEARGYMQAVNTYFAAKGRLPGDPENTGKMGRDSGNNIPESDYDIIYDDNASWFDLNREGIVDWDKDKDGFYGKESKYLKKTNFNFLFPNTFIEFSRNSHLSIFKDKNVMTLTKKYDSYISFRIAANIEEKMDNKSLDTGNVVVGLCSEDIHAEGGLINEFGADYFDITTYEDLANAKKGGCDEVAFKLDL